MTTCRSDEMWQIICRWSRIVLVGKMFISWKKSEIFLNEMIYISANTFGTILWENSDTEDKTLFLCTDINYWTTMNYIFVYIDNEDLFSYARTPTTFLKRYTIILHINLNSEKIWTNRKHVFANWSWRWQIKNDRNRKKIHRHFSIGKGLDSWVRTLSRISNTSGDSSYFQLRTKLTDTICKTELTVR